MRNYTYVFTFKGGDITARANSIDEGKILAQAEAIKNCWNYSVISCRVIR